jgi:glycosyltransferase involved in cell wall biosynthesis
VVCTRNRSGSLALALDAILAMDFPAGRWELLVVDNGSTDDTASVAGRVAQGRAELITVIEEPSPGLSAARNRGIRAARGEIVAFVDDDAFPEAGWLRALVEVIRQEGAWVAGGPVVPIVDGELPGWFGDRYLPYLAVWNKGPEVQALTYNEYPRGVNMAFHRDVFREVGDFSPHLGRKGSSLLSCEEIELCLRVERAGGRILYTPCARVRHLIPAARITPRWLARRFMAQAHSEAILIWQHAGLRGLLRGLRPFIKSAPWIWHQLRSPPEGRVYARCQRSALLGYVRGFAAALARVPRYQPRAGAAQWLPPT